MSNYEFSFSSLRAINLNVADEKEYMQFCIDHCTNVIANASDFVRRVAEGKIDIDKNTKPELMAARASMLLIKQKLEEFQEFSSGKSNVKKFYADALAKNESNFKQIGVAEDLLKTYFML